MVTSSSLLSFSDCTELMDRALAEPKGLRVSFKSMGPARHFRVRCHQARKLHRQQNAETYELSHPLHGRSEYDALLVRIRWEPSAELAWVYFTQNKIERLHVEPIPDNIDVDDLVIYEDPEPDEPTAEMEEEGEDEVTHEELDAIMPDMDQMVESLLEGKK